jgi:hypothetical protein
LNVPKTWPTDRRGAARYDLVFVFDRPTGDGPIEKFSRRQMTVATLKLLVNIRSSQLEAMPVYRTLRRHEPFCMLDQLVIELAHGSNQLATR